jgi:hypothetical protein
LGNLTNLGLLGGGPHDCGTSVAFSAIQVGLPQAFKKKKQTNKQTNTHTHANTAESQTHQDGRRRSKRRRRREEEEEEDT